MGKTKDHDEDYKDDKDDKNDKDDKDDKNDKDDKDEEERVKHRSLEQLVEPELLLDHLPAQLRVEVVHRCHFVSMECQHSLFHLASKYIRPNDETGNLILHIPRNLGHDQCYLNFLYDVSKTTTEA